MATKPGRIEFPTIVILRMNPRRLTAFERRVSIGRLATIKLTEPLHTHDVIDDERHPQHYQQLQQPQPVIRRPLWSIITGSSPTNCRRSATGWMGACRSRMHTLADYNSCRLCVQSNGFSALMENSRISTSWMNCSVSLSAFGNSSQIKLKFDKLDNS